MKICYLLRDNMESGPFTAEELRSQQLQELDLIWMEGKSVVWKYPSEIKEFQHCAPRAKMTEGTLVNNRKEQQINYFRYYVTPQLATAAILPDAYLSDIPTGYEYLVRARMNAEPVDYSISEQILEEVFAVEAEGKVVESKAYTVLGAAQLIDTAEVAATKSFFEHTVEMPFRNRTSTADSKKVKKKKRGTNGFSGGLAAWATVLTAAFIHLKL